MHTKINTIIIQLNYTQSTRNGLTTERKKQKKTYRTGSSIFGRSRSLTIASMIAAMSFGTFAFNVRVFGFQDDNFAFPEKWIKAFVCVLLNFPRRAYFSSASLIGFRVLTMSMRRCDNKCHKMPSGRGGGLATRITWVGVTIMFSGIS